MSGLLLSHIDDSFLGYDSIFVVNNLDFVEIHGLDECHKKSLRC